MVIEINSVSKTSRKIVIVWGKAKFAAQLEKLYCGSSCVPVGNATLAAVEGACSILNADLYIDWANH